MNPEMASLLDLGNTGFIILAVIYLLREISKRDEMWRGFIREQNQEMQRVVEQNASALAEMSKQIERVTAVMLLSAPEDDAERMKLVRRIFE